MLFSFGHGVPFEPTRRLGQEFVRHREVDLGAAYVDVPHVGGQPRKEGLDVGLLAVPFHEAMNRERVAEVMNPDVQRLFRRFGNTRNSTSPAERIVNTVLRKGTALPRREEWRLRCVQRFTPSEVLL
jgi:hypothetical protein